MTLCILSAALLSAASYGAGWWMRERRSRARRLRRFARRPGNRVQR